MSFGSQAWVASHEPARRVEVQIRIWPSFLDIGIALLFLALGCFGSYASLTTSGPRSWIVWPAGLIIAAFGLVQLVSTVVLLATSKPALVIDAEGFSHALYGSVKWSDVAGLAVENRNKRAYLTLGLVPGAEIARGWRWRRVIQRTHALWVSIEGMDHSPNQIFQAALAARDKVKPPRIPTWHYSFSARLIRALIQNDRLLAEAEEIAGRPNRGPKDEAEALANAQRIAAFSNELAAAMQEQGKAIQRSSKIVSHAIVALTVSYGLLWAVRLVLEYR